MSNQAFHKGEEKYKQRDFEGAVLAFTLALESDPGNPEILYQRGMAYFHLGKKSLALMDMDMAVEMQPNYSFRYASRAFMRDAFGDVMGAISDYQKAISLDPEDAIAHNNLGILEEKMGRHQISQVHFQRADILVGRDSSQLPNSHSSQGTTINYSVETTSPIAKEEAESTGFWTTFFRVFTDKNVFLEWWDFLKSGLRIRK
jgi:tetratricopeptide (TPR) repeat protein